MKKTITDQELRELYDDLGHKGNFLVSVAPKVKRSPSTVKLWFSGAVMTNDIPEDEKIRKILKRELTKAPKRIA